MISKVTFCNLLLGLIIGGNTISVTAQNKLIFKYNEKDYEFETFEEVRGIIGKTETHLYALEKEIPTLVQEEREVKRETGVHFKVSTFRDPIIFPIPQQHFVKYEVTAKEKKKRQRQQTKSAETAFAGQLNGDKVDKIALLKKAKEAELEQLRERIKKGEKDAVKDLERLSEELIQIIEGNLEGISLTAIEDALAYFNISIFIPYEDGKYEKEIVLHTGELEIIELNESGAVAQFKGSATTYCDEWDEEAIKIASKKLGRTIEGKAEIERGKIEGTIKLVFTSFVDER